MFPPATLCVSAPLRESIRFRPKAGLPESASIRVNPCLTKAYSRRKRRRIVWIYLDTEESDLYGNHATLD